MADRRVASSKTPAIEAIRNFKPVHNQAPRVSSTGPSPWPVNVFHVSVSAVPPGRPGSFQPPREGQARTRLVVAAVSCYKRNCREGIIARICILASGSSGNCALLASGRTRILVDAGLSRRETFARLGAIGEDPGKLDAIVISHEHTDHVSGLPVLAKTLEIPVLMTHLARQGVNWNGYTPRAEIFQAGTKAVVGDIEIETFTVPHDAADPVGFCFRIEGLRVGFVTDLGYIPDSIRRHLSRTDFLVFESNHDLEMLKVGPYPWAVKQRVMGRNGHLSNDVASGFIRNDMDPATATLVLGHLSQHNNHPELARLVAAQALAQRGLNTNLVVADQHHATEVFYI